MCQVNIVRDYKRYWAPVHLDFLTENIDEVVKNILHLDGLYEGGESGDWDFIAYCANPFGKGFCVISK